MPLHSSLGKKSETPSQKKKKRTLVKLPRPSRVCIQKATKYLKDVTLQKQCMPFQSYNGGVGRGAQAKQWGWTQVGGPERVLNFCCTCLKMQRVVLSLRVSMWMLWSLSISE